MNEIPDAICWHEGMQLLPQHFQQQSLRAENMAAFHVASAHPWFWGIHHVDIDESALSSGTVRILALSAVLPDGLPIGFEAGSGDVLTLDIATAMADLPRPILIIYLAVAPLWRAGRLDARSSRYASVTGEAVPDLASGESPEPLVLWRPQVRLVTEENKADFVYIPLLRITRQGGGFAALPYVPPGPRLLPESLLGRKVAALCARVREKSIFLAGRLRLTQQTGQQDALEITRQLRSLLARLPETEAALSSRIAHPAQMHLLLTGMAGSLATLDLAAGIPAFSPLRYEDLLAGFDEVINWLLAALERVRMGYRTIAFAHDSAGYWLALPTAAASAHKLVIGLRMPAGGEDSAASQWLQHAIIAAESHLPTLKRQRMRGISWQPLERSTQVSYSVGADTRLFVLDTRSEWFDANQCLRIVSTGALAEPWEVVLFVTEQQGPDSNE